MKTKQIVFTVSICAMLFMSCKQTQEARMPISQASGSFMKKSIERNKKIVASEENQIKAVIKNNPGLKYKASTKGYWYSYQVKNELDTLTPKKGDVAFFEYEIKDLKGAVIYTKQELKPQTYNVDKQNIIMGLRDGIKLMRKKETITFLFPSHMAYGFHGDSKKIGTNQPLICVVTLQNFVSEIALRKQNEVKIKTAVLPESEPKKVSQDTLTQNN